MQQTLPQSSSITNLAKLAKIGKKTLFQSLFVLQRNTLHHKYLNLAIQALQIFCCIFFYINPIFSHLNSFSLFKQYFDGLYSLMAIFQPSTNLLINWIIMLILPSFGVIMVLMKLFIGYNFFLILGMEIVLLIVPVFYIKFCLQTLNILVNSGNLIPLSIVIVILNMVACFLILQLYNKKQKLLQFLYVILFFSKLNQYALLGFLAVKIGVQFWLYRNKKLRNVKFGFELSLLIILISCYFATDYITNYISFMLLVLSFTGSPAAIAKIDIDQNQEIFYYLQNLTENKNKIKFYQYCQKHITKCQVIHCQCRKIVQIKQIQEIKKWGFQLIKNILKIKENLNQRLQFAEICCDKYDYNLLGLSRILKIKPTNIIEQYRIYYVVTRYQEEYRKSDKNYTFGQSYMNVHEEIQKFQCSIEQLTYIIHKFWLSIIDFDGSKNFLKLIIDISNKINEIKKNYLFYNDIYEDYVQFKYFYKTFELAILNIQPQKQELTIKIPDKQLFFVSSEQKIINCNIEFCNLVQCQKRRLIGTKYAIFIPDVYVDHHPGWVQNFIESYHPDDIIGNLKTIKFRKDYIKLANITNCIIPRFNQGVQILTILKIENDLQDRLKITQDAPFETFFSFLIEKDSLKIISMDQSFFEVAHIEESQYLKDKIVGLKINELFPKIYITENKLNEQTANREVMINYSAIQEMSGARQKYYSSNNSKNFDLTEKNNHSSTLTKRKLEKKKSLTDRQGIFNYQIILQKNFDLQVQYCIANFKLKSNIYYDNNNSKQQLESFQSNQNIGDAITNSEQSQMLQAINFNFSLPFPLIGCLVCIHFIYLHTATLCDSLFNYSQNTLEFYLLYDYTSLFYMNVSIGEDKLAQLNKLWILGYGFFSDSLVNFQKAADPQFYSNLYSQNIQKNHNSIYNIINDQMQSQISYIQLWRYIVLFCLVGFIALFSIDLWASIKYTMKVYKNVKNIIFTFLNIANEDIKMMLSANQAFQVQVLQLREFQDQIKEQPYFDQQGQNSINNLMKLSYVIDSNSFKQQGIGKSKLRKERTSSRRSSSRSLKQDLISLKEQIKLQNNSSFAGDLTLLNNSQKQASIQKFKKTYGQKWTIFEQNSSLFIILGINFVLVVLIFISFIIVVPTFITNYQAEAQLYQSLRLMPIVIFKSMITKMTNYSLVPSSQINVYSNLISNTANQRTQIPKFSAFWHHITNNDICSFVEADLFIQCKLQKGITAFGQKVVYQQLQQYLRQSTSSDFLLNSQDFMKIAKVELNLLQISAHKLQNEIKSYMSWSKFIQQIMVIIGSVLLVISIYVSYRVLEQFRDKIKNTQNLLMIVPKEIQTKNRNSSITLTQSSLLQKQHQNQIKQKQRLSKHNRSTSPQISKA